MSGAATHEPGRGLGITTTILQRELLVAGRKPTTYWLRVLAGGLVLGTMVWWDFEARIMAGTAGDLFEFQHALITLLGSLLAALLTANAVSGEFRNGTIGLLFLTGMNATDVICAKLGAHAIRAVTFWVVAQPMLAIPVIFGGIQPGEVILSALLSGSAVVLALGAGLWASAVGRTALDCNFRAILLALASSIGVFLLTGSLIRLAGGRGGSIIARGEATFLKLDEVWKLNATPGAPGAVTSLLVVGLEVTLVSVLASLLITRLAAWVTWRRWLSELSPGGQSRAMEEAAGRENTRQPRGRSVLEENPIVWLERRTWRHGWINWGPAIAMAPCFGLLLPQAKGLEQLHILFAVLIAAAVGLAASGSFLVPRESGFLELMLVTPLKPYEIIGGKILGILRRFLPALGVWGGLSFLGPLWSDLGRTLCVGVIVLTVPAAGLFYSLSPLTPLSAFLRTMAVGVVLPVVLASMLGWRFELVAGVQLWIGLWFAMRLLDNLQHRRFALERVPT